MKQSCNSYITLYFALTIGVMLALIFTLTEGVRRQTIRTETEGVMDIGLHSVFGEYHRQLLEQYDLFYIDTSYGENLPSIEATEEHLQYYMNLNFEKPAGGVLDLTGIRCDNVKMTEYLRPTDHNGKVLQRQAVEYISEKSGMSVAEDVLTHLGIIRSNSLDTRDIAGERASIKEGIEGLLERKRQELRAEGVPEEEIHVSISNPADSVDAIRGTGILGLALPEGRKLSAIAVDTESYQSHRCALTGKGRLFRDTSGIEEGISRLLFQKYLFEKCGYFGRELEKSLLKYQMEYLIKGGGLDRENLEEVLEDILQIREAANLLHLFSDSEKQAQADMVAAVVTALLGIPKLQELVKLSILFAWSYAESVKDVRILLEGNRVPLLKDADSWNTPLSQLLTFTSHLDEYRASESGMSYEDYLRVFLYMQPETTLCFRFMDVCEMDIRLTPDNAFFRMDGCVEAVTAKVNVSSGYGYGYDITRSYHY